MYSITTSGSSQTSSRGYRCGRSGLGRMANGGDLENGQWPSADFLRAQQCIQLQPVAVPKHQAGGIAAAEAVLGGWQMGAIWKMDSGLPLIFSAPNNVFNYNQWQFPNIKQGVSLAADNRNIDRWFNTGAFEQPAPFTYGTAPRYVDAIRYSRGNNWDMSLAKNFKIWERLRLQYRAEMY